MPYVEFLFLLIPLLCSIYAEKLSTGLGKIIADCRAAFLVAPFILSFAFVMTYSLVLRHTMSKSTEYLNYNATSVVHNEPWDERVACSHSYDCDCHLDSDGLMYCYTCYEHDFDVRYHQSEYFMVSHTVHGKVFMPINRDTYMKYAALWHKQTTRTQDHFNEIGVSYAHESFYDNITSHSATFSIPHTYQADAQVVYGAFEPVHMVESDIIEYDLKRYPPFNNSVNLDFMLGYSHPMFERWLGQMNGELGSSKEIVHWLIIFKNQPEIAAKYQETFWKGGNKNESVICMSVDDKNKIQWCDIFTWSQSTTYIKNVKQYFNNRRGKKLGEVLNLQTIETLKYEARTHWERREFSELNASIDYTIPRKHILIMLVGVVVLTILSMWVLLNYDNF